MLIRQKSNVDSEEGKQDRQKIHFVYILWPVWTKIKEDRRYEIAKIFSLSGYSAFSRQNSASSTTVYSWMSLRKPHLIEENNELRPTRSTQ